MTAGSCSGLGRDGMVRYERDWHPVIENFWPFKGEHPERHARDRRRCAHRHWGRAQGGKVDIGSPRTCDSAPFVTACNDLDLKQGPAVIDSVQSRMNKWI